MSKCAQKMLQNSSSHPTNIGAIAQAGQKQWHYKSETRAILVGSWTIQGGGSP